MPLLEFLLTCDDASDSAKRALEWLGESDEIRDAICLVPSADGTHLVPIARLQAAGNGPVPFAIDLRTTHDPLARAFDAGDAWRFDPDAPRRDATWPATPLGRVAFSATRLETKTGQRAGLLLLTPPPTRALDDVRWLGDILAGKLLQLRSHVALTQSERQVAHERGLLHAVIDAVPDPVLLTDAHGTVLTANARARTLLAVGAGADEAQRSTLALNRTLFAAALSRDTNTGPRPAPRELRLIDPVDGSDLLFELGSTSAGEAQASGGIVSILRNVTDLRRATGEIEENYRKLRLAEADVRAERDRLDVIIDSVADPIVVTDPAGRVVLMNTPAERVFSPHASDTSIDVQRAVQTNDAHFASFVANAFASDPGTRHRGEIALIDPASGDAMPVEAIAGRILAADGQVTAVVTILHDRTEAIEKARLYEQLETASRELEQKVRDATAELVRQNELLRRQAIELEQASELKSQFLANMSHEFRTPLNAILGYTSMLLQGVSGEMTAQQKRSLQRVDSNGRHLLNIINDILDISRVEAGRMPLHLSEFALPELIDEVMAEVEPIIQRTRLVVTSELQEGLPAVRSDRQKVKQIVLNLLTNALKFTPEGSVRVRVGHERETDSLVIRVTDTGIGIAEKDQAKVFEDFQQADNSPTREYGGTGLGLSICRRLATMMGGRITLDSRIGSGSTFALVLPRRPRRK